MSTNKIIGGTTARARINTYPRALIAKITEGIASRVKDSVNPQHSSNSSIVRRDGNVIYVDLGMRSPHH